jgi:lipid A 4'-phosphatase
MICRMHHTFFTHIQRCGCRILRHPLKFMLLVSIIFICFPALDRSISSLFYDPSSQWGYAKDTLPHFLHKGMPKIIFGILGYIALLWLCGKLLKTTFLGITSRTMGFLLSSLILGPGLVVNSILKPLWGRARPSQILEFGGQADFSRAWVITDQCSGNCSFVSGHAAIGFWTIAFAAIVPGAWRIPAMAVAFGCGILVGGGRIVQGGHFTSDVLISGLLTIACIAFCYKKFYAVPLSTPMQQPPTQHTDTLN